MNEVIDFKYKDCGQDYLSNKKHSHSNCYEILHVSSGNGIIMIKNKLYPIKSNSVYFINGMDIHCSVPDIANQYVRSRIVISAQYIDKLAELTDSSEMIESLFENDAGTCIELEQNKQLLIDLEFKKINDELLKKQACTKMAITSSVLRILSIADKPEDVNIVALSNTISDVLEYININIEKSMTLDDICKHVHLSKSYLCHTFKKLTNMTIFEYILHRRLSIAKKKLVYTQMPLSKIAFSTGFSDFAYFSKIFRQFEGVTPRDFRKNAKLS